MTTASPRRAVSVTALLLALGVLAATALPRAADAAPVRIMPLGDSITDGYNVPGGYRIQLEDALVADGYPFDFVGSRTNGPASLADRQHEGHSGRRIDELALLVDSAVARHDPQVVLLAIGTNDVLQSHALAQAPQRLSDLIDRIARGKPSATILVASLTPLTDGVREARVRDYNAAIPTIVRDKAARGIRVRFVDMHSALTSADLADGVHPNVTGYRKMATVWRAALPAATPDVPAPAPTPDGADSPPTTEDAPPGLVGAVPVARPKSPASTRRLIRIDRSRLRADRRGRVRVRLSCRAVPPAGCTGEVRLHSRSGERRRQPLARRSFRLSPAETARVSLRLQRDDVRRLRRRASTRVSIAVAVRHADGSRQVTRLATRLAVG